MSFIALVCALALTYYQPHRHADWLYKTVVSYLRMLERNFNAGKNRHGVLAWILGVLTPYLAVAAIYCVLRDYHPVLSIAWGAIVLYFTLRFSHFNRHLDKISAALESNDIAEARSVLASWEMTDTSEFTPSMVAKVSIETTLRRVHQGLFAPIFWFAVLGPAGALFYRLTQISHQEWQQHTEGRFADFSRKAFNAIDWLPARMTAGSFAIVGDFEDAAYCWRTQAHTWATQNLGIILASGAGALGVKLGEGLAYQGHIQHRAELGLGTEADADGLRSSAGLVWRSLVLIVCSLLLLNFAHWLGN